MNSEDELLSLHLYEFSHCCGKYPAVTTSQRRVLGNSCYQFMIGWQQFRNTKAEARGQEKLLTS